MKRIFLDSSVFFSAAYSASGHSRDLLMLAARGEITLAISDLVVEETRRNLEKAVAKALPFFELILHSIPFEFVYPTKKEVIEASRVVELKDAPILAAARKVKANFLVTLDKKHLLSKHELVNFAGMPIITPKEAMGWIQRKEK